MTVKLIKTMCIHCKGAGGFLHESKRCKPCEGLGFNWLYPDSAFKDLVLEKDSVRVYVEEIEVDMATKEESAIRTNIVRHIEKSGGWALVVSGSNTQASGTPDIIANVPTTFVDGFTLCAIEVKTFNGKPSQRQIEILRHMGQRGFVPFIVTSLQEFDNMFKTYCLGCIRDDHKKGLDYLKTQWRDRYDIWDQNGTQYQEDIYQIIYHQLHTRKKKQP